MNLTCTSKFRQRHVENALILQSMQGFYFSKTPVHRWNLVRHLATKLQQTNCILCRCIANSRDYRPLSKQLRHTLQWILQWPSGMTIITSALQVVYFTEECVSYLYVHGSRYMYVIYVLHVAYVHGLFTMTEAGNKCHYHLCM